MTHTVYAVLDPFTKLAVYIGVSSDPYRRCYQHNTDPTSAVYDFGRRYDELCIDVQMIALADFDSRADAERLERDLISMTPGLLNRQGQNDNRPHVQRDWLHVGTLPS